MPRDTTDALPPLLPYARPSSGRTATFFGLCSVGAAAVGTTVTCGFGLTLLQSAPGSTVYTLGLIAIIFLTCVVTAITGLVMSFFCLKKCNWRKGLILLALLGATASVFAPWSLGIAEIDYITAKRNLHTYASD